jgi:hypothetical protein
MAADPKRRESYPIDAVIKMGIGNSVRRIYLDRVVDENGLLSYNMLARWAICYSKDEDEQLMTPKDLKSFVSMYTLEITYIDEEEDRICFSSDGEFVDAIIHYSKILSKISVPNIHGSIILRCKAIVGERKLKNKKNKLSEKQRRLLASAATDADKKTNDEVARKDSSSQTGHIAFCDAKLPALEEPTSKKNVCVDELAGFDRGFLHARHTCDGCGKAPVVGIRYHAQNIPDYDYCANCMANYKGTEIIFKPEQLAGDTRFQSRCPRKGNRGHCNMMQGQCFTVHGPSHSDDLDLLHAIRISLMEEESRKEAIKKSAADSNHGCPDEKDLIDLSEPAVQRNEEGFEFLPNNDNVAKAIDVIGMSIAQTAFIIGSVVNDICENRRKTKNGIAGVAPDCGPDMTSEDMMRMADAAIVEVVCPISTNDKQEKEFHEILLSQGTEDVAVCPPGLPMESLLDDVEASLPGLSMEASLKSTNDALKGLDNYKPLAMSQEKGCIKENSPEEEWDMVDSGHDALVAIGSALYREDLIRSTEELSLTKNQILKEEYGDEYVSIPSVASVQTMHSEESESDSISNDQFSLNAFVLARWDKELEELRGLGFSDDLKSLEALESLEAASIGVDSDAAITVNMAVNWLLNRAEKSCV